MTDEIQKKKKTKKKILKFA